MASEPVSTSRATVSAFVAELFGTFMFTFSGTATVCAVYRLHPAPGFSPISDIAISLAFALGVLAAVYAFAKISGAHLNPAVTLALAIVGKFPWREVPVYVVAQFSGGILAGLMNWFMFGDAIRKAVILGSTHPGPHVGFGTAIFTEFVITAMLMIVIMATAVFERAPGGGMPAGLAIGFWVGAAIFLALPISGGSLNPARTLGPDIASMQFPDWWVYFVGPICGAAFGAAVWHFVLARGRAEVVESADTAKDSSVTDQAA